jgi:hypothetical protein
MSPKGGLWIQVEEPNLCHRASTDSEAVAAPIPSPPSTHQSPHQLIPFDPLHARLTFVLYCTRFIIQARGICLPLVACRLKLFLA